MSDCLLIDAGNTNLKWAISRNGKMTTGGRMTYADKEFMASLPRLWPLSTPPQRVLLSSVAGGNREGVLERWVETSWGLPLELVQPQAQACGVVNGYAQPARLGADRWAALIGARHLRPGALCVVDCGTATTLDILDAGGRHRGGLIVPGLGLMRASLFSNTAAVRGDVDGAAGGLLSSDTQAAVSAGSLQATVGFIERLQREAGEMLGVPLTMILCGGSAPDLLPLLPREVRHEPDLVLKGLNIIAMNKS